MDYHGAVSLSLSGKHILLIIGGGIAAYKTLELIRRCANAVRGCAPC
jgi:phosphopantothenoylcysteine decarboxylase/phosphopantothenate--cysteine ligase